jgi:hypothetical protein
MAYRFQQVVEPRGGELIGRGIASFGEAMGRGMAQGAELKAESQRYSKLLEAMGEDPGVVSAMSLGAKRGAFDALTLKRADVLREQQRDEGERFRKAMALTRAPAEGGPAVPMAEAMGMAGVSDPRLIQAGLSMHEAMTGGGQFEPRVLDLGGGVKAMTTSRNSAVPLHEAMGGDAVQFIQAPDGSYVVRDARGGVKQLRTLDDGGEEKASLGAAVMSGDGNGLMDGIRELRKANQELIETAGQPEDSRFGWPWNRRSKADELQRLQQRRIEAVRKLQAAGVTLGRNGALLLRGREIDRVDGLVPPVESTPAGKGVRTIDFNSLP